MATDTSDATWLDLYDWRRRVAALFAARDAALHTGDDPAAVHARFRAAKDALFARHPQSPLAPEDRANFPGLAYFPYDAALRVRGVLSLAEDAPPAEAMPASGAHTMGFRRAAMLRFALEGNEHALAVYWIDVYGGGLFIPFRDATSGKETYGGGRYLIDTVKGSDLQRDSDAADPFDVAPSGYAGGPVIVDFNYSYNPSCAYDARWVCPLSPRENLLPVAIRAGELAYHG